MSRVRFASAVLLLLGAFFARDGSDAGYRVVAGSIDLKLSR